MQTKLIACNIECDKKNRTYNIAGMTDAEIQRIKENHKWPKWVITFA